MKLLGKEHLFQFIPKAKACCDNRSFKNLKTGIAGLSNILYKHSQTVLTQLGDWGWRAEIHSSERAENM